MLLPLPTRDASAGSPVRMQIMRLGFLKTLENFLRNFLQARKPKLHNPARRGAGSTPVHYITLSGLIKATLIRAMHTLSMGVYVAIKFEQESFLPTRMSAPAAPSISNAGRAASQMFHAALSDSQPYTCLIPNAPVLINMVNQK